MSNIPRIPCPTCHGHGEVDLPAPYGKTLGRIDGEWRDTSAILRRHRDLAPVRRTALINRLNKLVALGLADRRGAGRMLQWRRV